MMDMVSQKNAKMQLIEGRLSKINLEPGTFNILEELSPKVSKFNKMAILLGPILGNTGAGSGALVAAMQNNPSDTITCQIDAKPLIGVFAGANLLQEGDQVRAVVTNIDSDTQHVYAIERPSDGLLFLPIGAYGGRIPFIKSLLGLFVFFVLGANGMFIFSTLSDGNINWGLVLFGFPLSILLIGAIFLFATYKTIPLVRQAERIFKVLGYPRPYRLSLARASFYLFHRQLGISLDNYRSVFYYQRAIDAMLAGKKVKIEKLPTPKGVYVENNESYEERQLKKEMAETDKMFEDLDKLHREKNK